MKIKLFSFIFFLVTPLFLLTFQTHGQEVYIQRLDVGSNTAYTDSIGQSWAADQAFTAGSYGYVGGSAYSKFPQISGTTDDLLYQTTRYATAFEYRFTVPSGSYSVTLKLAEIKDSRCQLGARVFNVSAEGQIVIGGNDTFARVGCTTAGDRTFTTTVSDGILNLNFSGVSGGYPSVNGIEVIATSTASPSPTPTPSVTPSTSPSPSSSPTPTPTPTPLPTFTRRVDLGRSANFTDSIGNVWLLDRSYSASAGYGYTGSGTATYLSSSAIANTTEDTLYQTTRRSSLPWGYNFDLPNGDYNVTLKFAEIYSPSFVAGSRVGNYSLEGSQVLTNFDVFAQAQVGNSALDKTFPVTVADGQLNINITPVTGSPAINAIEITAGLPDFSLSTEPTQATVGLSGSVTTDVAVWFQNGFSSTNTNLSVTGLLAGISADFQPNPLPHQGKSVLVLTNDGTTPVGNYNLSLRADSEGITHTVPFTLVVTDQPDFTIDPTPVTQSVEAGSSVNYQILYSLINNYSNPVNLSVTGLPNGVTANFNLNPADPSQTSIISLNTSTSTISGAYTLTITATDGNLTKTTQMILIVSNSKVWSILPVGTTGSDNNTVRVGQPRNDGVNRVYVGTVSTGRVFEFSWDGSSWGSPIDIGGSPLGREIHNMNIGPGRNDGIERVYACSLDGNLYEVSYDGVNWSQNIVGTIDSACYHSVVADLRHDGVQRLYAGRGTGIYEYSWNGNSWDQFLIGRVSGGIAHGTAVGVGRNDGILSLYITSSQSGMYEAKFENGSWGLNQLGDNGDVRNATVGVGRNDGINRIYAGTAAGTVRELSWNGTLWVSQELNNPIGTTMVHAYVLDGRGDGINRIYASSGNGNGYELAWNGSQWSITTLGGGTGYLYGFHFGAARNDNKLRLYGASFNQQVYEYTF